MCSDVRGGKLLRFLENVELYGVAWYTVYVWFEMTNVSFEYKNEKLITSMV